jgi:hypothetical protein
MMIETFTPISLVNDLKAGSIASQFLNARTEPTRRMIFLQILHMTIS